MRGGLCNISSATGGDDIPRIQLNLLGGFRAERLSVVPESAWQQRRSAKSLVKLIATHPGHSLHREQILELLWPEVDFTSAVNSFGKALHAARRALEPDIPSRGTSSYLRLADDVLCLVMEHVSIDADRFQAAAEEAFRRNDVASFERALSLYTGELLPEDTYESWTAQRRDALADLHLRLLLGLTETLERRGERDLAIERLTQVLQLDHTREDVHRQLMRMHAEGGRRLQALRQYQLCCEMLRDELDASPESATVALYEEIRADRIQPATVGGPIVHQEQIVDGHVPILPAAIQHLPATALFGREHMLRLLLDDLEAAESGRGQSVLVSGEVGVGKSTLVAEAAREAARKGALVLWGACHAQEDLLPYGPFAEALENYIATRDLSERQILAARYPELIPLVPSLALESDQQPDWSAQEMEQSRLFATIVRVLTDLASSRVVVLVLDDLHAAATESLQLLRHVVHLARQRHWLVLGTYREEDLVAGTEFQRMVTAVTRQGFCRHVNLRRLSRQESDRLVRALLERGAPSASLLEHVYTMSLGNPLFVTELMGAMQGRGELNLIDGYWRLTAPEGSVPRQIGRLVDIRINGLENKAKRILSLVAIGDTQVSYDELCTAAHEVLPGEISDASLLDILDSALHSHILEERDDGYTFAHPLFRAALRDRLSRQRRTQLHGALAHAIESHRPSEFEVLAYHYGRSSDQDKAFLYLELLADREHALGMREEEDAHLWELFEKLYARGRKGDAERVRQKLQILHKDTNRYDLPDELVETNDVAYQLQDHIA